jgi:hypothetical protein
MAREFNEELYYSTELRRSDVLRLLENNECVTINNYSGLPTYACLIVSVADLASLGVFLDPEDFHRRREMVLSQNPDIAPHRYRPQSLEKISYGRLSLNRQGCLSGRLWAICKKSQILRDRIPLLPL